MKKILGALSVITVMLFCLTGCSLSNTLKCTGEKDGSKIEYIASLKGDTVTKVELNNEYTAESEEDAKSTGESLEEYLETINEEISESGISINSKVKGKKVITNVKIDIEKVSESTLNKLFNDTELTKESFKEFAEDSGLTCK